MEKWASVGIDYAVVDGMLKALELDRSESEARAPRKTGKLAKTIKVLRPSAQRAQKTGLIRAAVVAGSRSGDRRKSVSYASVLQTGKVYNGPGGKTKPHDIVARKASYSGGKIQTTGVLALKVGGHPKFARKVHHPGSTFAAMDYLRVNEDRAVKDVDQALQASANRDL